MVCFGVESDSWAECMEAAPRVVAPVGFSGGIFTVASGDRMPAPPDCGLAANSPPDKGPVPPRKAMGS